MALVSRAVALCAFALLALAAPAGAGPPGQWTALNDAESNTLEVGLARSGNGLLNVLWTRDTAVLNTQISANARNVIGPHMVFVYGNGASNTTALLPTAGGGLRAFFAGLYPDDPHDVGMSTATSADGVGWAVQPTLASASEPGRRSPVYVASGIGGTILGNGTPLSIWGDSAPNAHGYHVGTSDQSPDVPYAGGGATAGGPNAATDSESGAVAIGWNDLNEDRTLIRMIEPVGDPIDFDPWFPPGPQINTPGGEAPDALERVAMTGRDGAGIFVAYLRGTNAFLSRATVWRIGAPNPMTLSPRRARFPGVARSVGGRLWAFWARRPSAGWRIYAARSNASATRFGATVTIRPPRGTDSLYSLEGEGTAPGGTLDILALAQGPNVDIDNFHQRIRPGITLAAKALGDGQVRFTTRDAGAALATTIKFAGKTAPTGSDGKVVMSAEPRRKRYKATATKAGYHPAAVRVRVK